MKIRTGVFLCNLFVVTMISITFCLLLLAKNTFENIQQTNQSNTLLLRLADELRASSKNLTENIRLYTTTNDDSFKKQYNTIVNVRGGMQERPKNAIVAPNEKIALLELLKIHGVTDKEYALVEQANNLSNTLIALEVEAMNAIEGKFKDNEGKYTIAGYPDTTKAIELVF